MAGFKTYRRNKYNNVKQTYNGYSYDSKMEARHAAYLDDCIKTGVVKSWTRQHKLELYVCQTKICNYYMDFRVEMSDGTIELHEVKGFETAIWRLKWKLTHALLDQLEPGAKLILIKK